MNTVSKTEQLSQEEYLKRCQAAANTGNVVAQNTLGFFVFEWTRD